MTRTPLRMRVERPSVTDYTTIGNDYVDVPFAKEGSTDTRVYWDAWHLAGVKILHFFATTKDLKVQILGSIDGTNFDTTLFAEFTLTAGSSSPVEKRIVAYWPYIKVQVKPSTSSQHGTLSVRAIGTTVSGESDTEVTATIDPGTLATESTLSSIKTAVEGATPAGTAIIGNVGIDQATANANEVVVKSITAGDPKLGTLVDGQSPVVAGYKTKRVNVVFTGMDATAQYDAVGALVEIPNWATANGRSATIREIRMSCNNNAIAPQFEIHFYRAADVTVAADNASWTEIAVEYDKRAGYILMPAMAKPAGSGTIDLVRCQNDDYGNGLSKEVTCAAGSTSIWAKLKLMTAGISFAGTPGNTIVAAMVIEQS